MSYYPTYPTPDGPFIAHASSGGVTIGNDTIAMVNTYAAVVDGVVAAGYANAAVSAYGDTTVAAGAFVDVSAYGGNIHVSSGVSYGGGHDGFAAAGAGQYVSTQSYGLPAPYDAGYW